MKFFITALVVCFMLNKAIATESSHDPLGKFLLRGSTAHHATIVLPGNVCRSNRYPGVKEFISNQLAQFDSNIVRVQYVNQAPRIVLYDTHGNILEQVPVYESMAVSDILTLFRERGIRRAIRADTYTIAAT